MGKKIRVLLANRPRLMRELMLEAFADQPDIEIVGETVEDAEILSAVERTHPDFVVIALENPGRRPAICDTVLHQYPEMRLIAVAPNHKCSVYYWASLTIHSHDVEASEASILSMVRDKTRSVGGVS